MRPDYDGVKFFSATDMSIGWSFKKAQAILDAFSTEKPYENINEILELYNVYQIIFSGGIKKEYTVAYEEKAKSLMKTTAVFFKGIDDSCFIEQYNGVCVDYLDDYWTLFEKFAVYKRVSQSVFLKLLEETDIHLRLILCHKKIVDYYDSLIADFMRQSDQSAEIIISVFLEKRSHMNKENSKLPNSLRSEEYESILDRYVDSEYSNIGLVQLMSRAQNTKEFPISDKLRLKAKRKATHFWKERIANGFGQVFGIAVCFDSNSELVTIDHQNPQEYRVTYDYDWIQENLDYPTLLNNFIYLFGYVDLHFRCVFPSKQNQLSVLEKLFMSNGIKHYETGGVFSFLDMKSSAEIQQYDAVLLSLGVRIEDVIQWFFSDYLREEFGIDNFVIHMPHKNSTTLQKCRDVASEMDGILHQYKLFVENGVLDRELFEMSSSSFKMDEFPSMIEKKYVYANSKEIRDEQKCLFSDQSLLAYCSKTKKAYGSFWALLCENTIGIADYSDIEQYTVRWLETRDTVRIDSDGVIHPNTSRVLLLKDLYEHEVICPRYYKSQDLINQLIDCGDLKYENKLFSFPEQRYLNFVLNKVDSNNGQELRNRYIHSRYPLDENQQLQDYYTLLKVLVLVVIKINEEFCWKYPQ